MKRLVIIACLILAWLLSASVAGVAADQFAAWNGIRHVGEWDIARYWLGHQQQCGQPQGMQTWTGTGAVQQFDHCTLNSTVTLEPKMSWTYQSGNTDSASLNAHSASTFAPFTASDMRVNDLLIMIIDVRKAGVAASVSSVSDGHNTWNELRAQGAGTGAHELSYWWAQSTTATPEPITVTVNTTSYDVAYAYFDFTPPNGEQWAVENDGNFPFWGQVTSSGSIPIAGNAANTSGYADSLAIWGTSSGAVNATVSSQSNSGYSADVTTAGASNNTTLFARHYNPAGVGVDLSDTVTSASSNWRWILGVFYPTPTALNLIQPYRNAVQRASIW